MPIISMNMPSSYWLDKARKSRRGTDTVETVRLYRESLRLHDSAPVRRELAEIYIEAGCFTVADRILFRNICEDATDGESLFALSKCRSALGDKESMAELLDLYIRRHPCGQKADQARDILWHMPRTQGTPRGCHRALTCYDQSIGKKTGEALKLLQKSYSLKKTGLCAGALCDINLHKAMPKKALRYALDACRLEPELLEHRLRLAACFHAAGMQNSVRKTLECAMALCTTPNDVMSLCRLACAINCPDPAIELGEKWVDKYPYSADLLLTLAAALRYKNTDTDKALSLLRLAHRMDDQHVFVSAMLGLDWSEKASADPTDGLREQLNRLLAEKTSDTSLSPQQMMLGLLDLPIPETAIPAAGLFLQTRFEEGLRTLLVRDDLPEALGQIILITLEDMGVEPPFFGRIDGHFCFLPVKPRPPYDADLHDLVRRLIKLFKSDAPIGEICAKVPAAWRRLPESARVHYARRTDDVWLYAFAAFVCCCSGRPQEADGFLDKCLHPRRCRRAYMMLLRRNHILYEMR